MEDPPEQGVAPAMSRLFSPYRIREVELPNRVVVSPMCQYSATDGLPGPWHLVHLGSRAIGGAGTVFTEASAVLPEGRISPADAGIWSDAHVDAWRPVTEFLAAHGAVPATQLAHAGFKGSTAAPWTGGGAVPAAEGGWTPVGPTEVAFRDDYPTPAALDDAGIAEVIEGFAAAAARALDAGFRVVEVHAAHGYLLHEFLSPLTNTRTDGWGGDRAGRSRLAVATTRAVRAAVGDAVPVLVRISATDWTPGGWTDTDSVALARDLVEAGADLIDCSSGGVVPRADIPVAPGYQVPLAARVRAEAGVPTGAVGMITEPEQAEQILTDGHADLILLARELLRDPYWPGRAAAKLGDEPRWPVQYQRAF
jgi:2,4-dienoyl-CoA reductase-like NADH-dependent reductase (Old Yellow Enzyme family)